EGRVEHEDRDLQALAQRGCELLGDPRLLAAFAAQRQWVPDNDLLGVLVGDEPREFGQAGVGGCALDNAERPRDHAGRVGHGDAGARIAEVERHHLHARAAATAFLPASRASRTPAGFLPPASASVGLPPPPPPMCLPRSRTICVASRPRCTSDSSKLTTRNARPSSTEPTITPSAFSC